MAPPLPERVGVVVVHGIGEQRRFDFLSEMTRDLVAALRLRPGAEVTVEISPGRAEQVHADRDTWRTDPPVTAFVRDGDRRVTIAFHEVWWADVNEPYSLFKQLRFWGWGLSLWNHLGLPKANLPTAGTMILPRPVLRWCDKRPGLFRLWVRCRLFLAAALAVLASVSIGIVTFLAQRLLGLGAPRFVVLFCNYLSAVKLYSQNRRHGAGLGTHDDFLDTLDKPPRVSIRRRMIRTLMEVAIQNYDRWYVLAHSAGTVVALNGLMEPGAAWSGYFTESEWVRARCQPLALVGLPTHHTVPLSADGLPPRPVWNLFGEIAYRSRIFRNFRGLLTFGSPLEKFAAVWPAEVPICRERAFTPGTRWINVGDPMDPVAGVLRAFGGPDAACVPRVKNLGYAAGWVLLWCHLTYFARADGRNHLADVVGEWLMHGRFRRPRSKRPNKEVWFCPNGPRYCRRRIAAGLELLLLVGFLLLLAGVDAPLVMSALGGSLRAAGAVIGAPLVMSALGGLLCATGAVIGRFVPALSAWVPWIAEAWKVAGARFAWIAAVAARVEAWQRQHTFLAPATWTLLAAFLVPLLAGVVARGLVFTFVEHDPRRQQPWCVRRRAFRPTTAPGLTTALTGPDPP